jgi:hypothetical protein
MHQTQSLLSSFYFQQEVLFRAAKVADRWQVTIPKALRERLSI